MHSHDMNGVSSSLIIQPSSYPPPFQRVEGIRLHAEQLEAKAVQLVDFSEFEAAEIEMEEVPIPVLGKHEQGEVWCVCGALPKEDCWFYICI